MKPVIFFVLALILLACNADEYNATKAAQDYCDCMAENGSPEQFFYAFKVCEGKMIEKNRYYRTFYVDMAYKPLDEKVTRSTRDSVQVFMRDFIGYLNDNCCKVALDCAPDSLRNYHN